MKFVGIETKSRFFIKPHGGRDWLENDITRYLFDGVPAEKTFHSDWFSVKQKPSRVHKITPQPNINHRFVLIDESISGEKTKAVFQREEVADYVDYSWVWKEEFTHLQSLYREESDKQPDKIEEIEFEIIVLLSLDELSDGNGLINYKIQRTRWQHDGTTTLTDKDVSHQIIDEIVFPSIILPHKPSKLTSKESYEIIRQFIKDNINPKVAKIDSDYDFCFSVQKRIPLLSPVKYTVDVGNRKPRYETRYRNERVFRIFEMTHDGENYKGYTPINGFSGENHRDLKEKIDFYLNKLIDFINLPVSDCPTCNGDGVIVKTEFEP